MASKKSEHFLCLGESPVCSSQYWFHKRVASDGTTENINGKDISSLFVFVNILIKDHKSM